MSFASRTRPLRSIRVILGIWFASTLVLITLLMVSVLYFLLRRDLENDYSRFLETYSSDLAANMIEHPPRSDEAKAAIRNEVDFFRPADVEYRVFDEHGRTFFSTDGWSDSPSSLSVGESATVVMRGQPYRATASNIEVGDGVTWRTETAISLGHVEGMLENYLRNVGLFSLPLVIASLLGGLFLARNALRPVARMTHTARLISSRSLGQRIALRGVGDELDDLAAALNEMLDRLEESFRRIERFSAELAHELRTPITQLVGETEAALMSAASDDRLRELLTRHAETYRSMANMVNDTLGLLRTGTPASAGEKVPVSLGPLLEGVVESFRALAEEKGVALAYRPTAAEVVLTCEPSAVRRMISNLLDNAIRHTEPGGKVELLARVDPESVSLTVNDTGEGIPEKDVGRVFERFYRSERTRASGAPGFGLGLSIVKQVVDEHGGTVGIESELGAGTTVRVRIPLGSAGS